MESIYKCEDCGFEVNPYITSVESNGFEGFCPKCRGLLKKVKDLNPYMGGILNNERL
jgi:hypothetical protein